MERVVERSNARAALKRVRQNKGSSGVDGMSVDELPAHLVKNWEKIRERLFTGAYQPQSVREVEIPKSDGGVCTLGTPTVLDRFIQQSTLQLLQPMFGPAFGASGRLSCSSRIRAIITHLAFWDALRTRPPPVAAGGPMDFEYVPCGN